MPTLPQPCGQGKYDSDWRSFPCTTEERANPDHSIQEWEGADPKQKLRQLSKGGKQFEKEKGKCSVYMPREPSLGLDLIFGVKLFSFPGLHNIPMPEYNHSVII